MSRWPMIRRYLPLAAVVAIQLMIVAAVPSRAPDQVAATGPGGAGSDFQDPFAGGVAPDEFDPDADPTSPGATRGSGGSGSTGSGGSDGSGSSARSGGSGGRAAAPAGDTSHCVNGRQFGTDIYFHAPPCVPKFGGENGGATYQGVTDEAIKVLIYDAELGAAVEAILEAQGSNPNAQEIKAFADSFFGWANEVYELYGRRFEVVVVHGQCPSVPPDYDCLRSEARQLNAEHKPFAFIQNTSLASPFFDEWSKLGVINIGGHAFRDQFSQLRRPYHYDVHIGGTQLTEMVAEWYCKRMYGNGQATAVHAGDPRFHDQQRVLGVISQDDPENKKAIDELNVFLQRMCGARVQHTYFYAQDINTAAQQKRAGVNRMREDPESTTVMCFCDQVAPQFLYQESQEQAYFPEHILVGTAWMDADASGQSYDSVPSANDGHQYGHNFHYAFGLAHLPDEEPADSNQAVRVWRQAGNSGTPPWDSAYRDMEYYAMLATLVQGAGPNLTPANVEAGAQRMTPTAPGGAGNPLLNLRGVRPAGDYTWFDSLREVYWSQQSTSDFNGEQGAWANLGSGRWYRKGEFPTGLIDVPKVPR